MKQEKFLKNWKAFCKFFLSRGLQCSFLKAFSFDRLHMSEIAHPPSLEILNYNNYLHSISFGQPVILSAK